MARAPLRLLAAQIEIPPTPDAASRDRHLAASAERVAAALARQPADLVVLPELSSLDYSRQAFGALAQLAEELDGPSFQRWSALAREHRCAVVYGFARRAGPDDYRISAAAVDASGALIGHYDKLHLAQFGASMEQEYFRRGHELLVFELCGLRIAPIICFDIRPPELVRALALRHRIDLVLHTGAYYRDPSFSSWHAFAQTRAVENQLYFLSLNRAGEHYGDSLFVPPWIDEHTRPQGFPAHAESLQQLLVDPAAIDAARRQYGFLAERLADYDLALNRPPPS